MHVKCRNKIKNVSSAVRTSDVIVQSSISCACATRLLYLSPGKVVWKWVHLLGITLSTGCDVRNRVDQSDRTTENNYIKNIKTAAPESRFAEMSKTALILLVEGAEEMETVIPADTLRRAGVKVTIAGVAGASVVNCSRDVKILPDDSLENALKTGPYDIVILPGGLKGSQNLADSAAVGALVQKQEAEGRLLAAICAAPTALKKYGVGKGKRVTSYPTAQDKMEGDGYTYCQDRVVIDGNLITSRGPGTALEFSLAIVEKLVGQETCNQVKSAMLFKE